MICGSKASTFAINISCEPSSITLTTLHSILTGLSAIAGALIFDDFCGVRFISLNLSTSLPERTPQ